MSVPYFSGMDSRDITWNCLFDRSEGAFHRLGSLGFGVLGVEGLGS